MKKLKKLFNTLKIFFAGIILFLIGLFIGLIKVFINNDNEKVLDLNSEVTKKKEKIYEKINDRKQKYHSNVDIYDDIRKASNRARKRQNSNDRKGTV